MRDPTLEEIASVLENAKIRHGELRACCPAHGGDNPEALSMTYRDGKLLATCHTRHCEFVEVMAAVRERLGESPTEERVKIRVGSLGRKERQNGDTETWDLKDAQGNLIAHHIRTDTPEGKAVRWKMPSGAWKLDRGTAELPLYGAEIVSRAPVNVPVVVTEGEKAADALRRAGIMGVGTVTGSSGTPSAESLEVLRGRKVILWPDNDKGGFEHMGRVAEGLVDVAAELLWYEWPDAPEKGDAADLPTSALDITELEAAPRWSRAPAIEGRVLLGRAITNGIDPPTELLPDILLAGKAHNIFAPGGVGKTWVLVWIATELIKRGKRVVVFDLENGFRTYAERFEEMGGEPEELDRLLYYYPFPVFDPESYAKMLDEVKPDLVMFDSWIGFLAAEGRDENEATDISAWAESYSKPALRRGTAIVVLDHVPHEHDDRERGSRRKRDEVDVAWRLAKIGDFDRERIGLLAMTRVKDREGWLPERLTFEVGGDVGTGAFVMRRNDELAHVRISHLSTRERTALRVLESFGVEGASTASWFERVREMEDEAMSKATLHRARRDLLEKGKIVEVSSGYAAKDIPHDVGVSGVSDTLLTQDDTGAPGGVSGVSPLTGVNTLSDTPPLRPVPVDSEVDVGGFGATKEEREKKYEEMKRKLRERRERRERERDD
jgi:hypothetical protein